MRKCLQVLQTHLWEAALVVQNPQYPMRLGGDEVNARLVVTEWDVLPGDLFPAVLLLHGDHTPYNIHCRHTVQSSRVLLLLIDLSVNQSSQHQLWHSLRFVRTRVFLFLHS